MLSVQNASSPVEERGGKPSVPEDLGRETAHLLLEEIYQVVMLASMINTLSHFTINILIPDLRD